MTGLRNRTSFSRLRVISRKAFWAIFWSVQFVACANGPCHSLRHPELAQQTTPTAPSSTGTDGKGDGTMADRKAGEGRVFVYKPDGSLQCGMAPATLLTDMETELQGIKVYSRENRQDGKMHIQVCGSPTGQVNVYEIPLTSLSDAEKLGFKKFEPGG